MTETAAILERLQDVGCDRQPFTPEHAKCICRLTNEAAAEIERLQGDLQVAQLQLAAKETSYVNSEVERLQARVAELEKRNGPRPKLTAAEWSKMTKAAKAEIAAMTQPERLTRMANSRLLYEGGCISAEELSRVNALCDAILATICFSDRGSMWTGETQSIVQLLLRENGRVLLDGDSKP